MPLPTEAVQEATGIPDSAVSTGLYDFNFTAIAEGGTLDVTKNAAKVNRPTYADDGSGTPPPSVYAFSGKAVNRDGDAATLPSGKYQLKFTAIKNF
ncbi:hypothetical protein HDU78_000490, partial [Chytriomyces hyalinus]